MFYKMFLDDDVVRSLEEYDAIAVLEWDIIVAHSSSFTRLYDATFFSPDWFWVKGSTLTGTEFHETAALTDMWYVLGHLNGNAICELLSAPPIYENVRSIRFHLSITRTVDDLGNLCILRNQSRKHSSIRTGARGNICLCSSSGTSAIGNLTSINIGEPLHLNPKLAEHMQFRIQISAAALGKLTPEFAQGDRSFVCDSAFTPITRAEFHYYFLTGRYCYHRSLKIMFDRAPCSGNRTNGGQPPACP